MTRAGTKLADDSQPRLAASLGDLGRPVGPAGGAALPGDRGLNDVESVARVGSYTMDILSGTFDEFEPRRSRDRTGRRTEMPANLPGAG